MYTCIPCDYKTNERTAFYHHNKSKRHELCLKKIDITEYQKVIKENEELKQKIIETEKKLIEKETEKKLIEKETEKKLLEKENEKLTEVNKLLIELVSNIHNPPGYFQIFSIF